LIGDYSVSASTDGTDARWTRSSYALMIDV
jgi:hypothetical protein